MRREHRIQVVCDSELIAVVKAGHKSIGSKRWVRPVRVRLDHLVG